MVESIIGVTTKKDALTGSDVLADELGRDPGFTAC